MSLRISVGLSGGKRITCMFDEEENRFVITSIMNAKEIAEALQAYIAESTATVSLPLELQSIDQTLADQVFTPESAPWLSYVRIAGNSVEGWDTSEGLIALSVTVFGDSDRFWEGSFVRLAIGSGPYIT